MNYRAYLIDDEPEAVEFLSSYLEESCAEIEVCGTANSTADAITEIINISPDLLFVDIQIDDKNGLELVEEIYNKGFFPYVIFVTAFDKHAVEAFKQNAVDYLLKPVDPDELKTACTRFKELFNKDRQYEDLRQFINGSSKKLRFNTRSGFLLFSPEEILYLEASQNYTHIFTGPEKSELVSINLGSVESVLPAGQFWRISKSAIINLSYLFKVDRKKRECTLYKSGDEVTLRLSRERIKDIPV